MASDHLSAGMRVNGFPIPVVDTRPESGGGFGLGFQVRVAPGRSAIPGSVGDFGWTGIWGTQFWVDPKEQMTAILLIQQGLNALLNRDFENAVMQAIVD
jgi:CubicO group peptidase (beta-lactamase class C family)